MKTISFNAQEISDLHQLCHWLSNQPCQSAFSGEINRQFPAFHYWISYAWKPKRRQVGIIYYQVGYGWRLHKNWQQKLERLSQEVTCQ